MGQVTDNFKILVGTLIALECFFIFLCLSCLSISIFNFFRPRSSRKGKPITNVSNTERPSNWASMPSTKEYTRVTLSTVSSEYKEVERLFKSSIKKRVVIRRIERVQNSFMWGKYQRYYLFIYIYVGNLCFDFSVLQCSIHKNRA